MNLNEEVNRYNTNSLKFDFKKEYNKQEEIFPMWVADMDFRCPEKMIEALSKRVEHGIFGYSQIDDTYFNAIDKWYRNNYDTNLKKEWLVNTPGVVFALATAVKTLTEENDYVIINSPVYFHFEQVVVDNKRNIISSDLVLKDGRYEIDFEDFENKIKKYKVKVYLLCSPHNPVGRVWTKEELDKIVDICRKNNVFIVSDEIHSDLVWKGKNICILKYENYKDNIILCTAASKTFNLAGLQTSNIFIHNKEVREKFIHEIDKTGYTLVNLLGLVACQYAYENGEEWLNEVKQYLIDNINYFDNFLKCRLPKIKLIYPEATYLLWVDFRELNLPDEKIEEIMNNNAKLWLHNGTTFGKTGRGFQRINIAVTRENLKSALKNMEKAFKDY